MSEENTQDEAAGSKSNGFLFKAINQVSNLIATELITELNRSFIDLMAYRIPLDICHGSYFSVPLAAQHTSNVGLRTSVWFLTGKYHFSILKIIYLAQCSDQ